jgi:predicted LPLAT superfamily acyltransferase
MYSIVQNKHPTLHLQPNSTNMTSKQSQSHHTMTLRSSHTNKVHHERDSNEFNKKQFRDELQDNVVQKQSVSECCVEYCDCYGKGMWRQVAAGKCPCVRALVNSGADVNAARTDNGATAVFIAAQNGHLDVVRALIEAGADVNAARTDNGCTPVFNAAENGHLEVVRVLVEAGADVNSARTTDGVTPVFMAAQNGHLEVVRVLVVGKE